MISVSINAESSSLLVNNRENSFADHTYAKITWRLIPFLAVLWILAWLDRVNIGYAKLQMLDDLAFSEAVYGLGAGIFFLGYFFFEVPSNLFLEKIGARKTIMRITIGWGFVCIAQMFVTSAGMFYFLRFLLGAFEAGFYPGIILYLTYWYPAQRRARAFGLFMSAAAIAGIIGGPLAGWIMANMDGVNGWSGWQWVFLIEGIPSVLAGFATWLYLVDKPEHANWLSAQEKKFVLDELAREQQDLGARESSLLASLRNPKLWMLILIFFCILSANSALTFFGPTLVKDLGFTDVTQIGWLMASIYVLGGAAMVLISRSSDKHNEARLHCGMAAMAGALGLVALGLLSFSPLLSLLALAIAVIGTMGAIPVFWQLPNLYLCGTAAAGGIALINSIANLAGFATPWALGAVRTMSGSFSSGLLAIGLIEFSALILIVVFIKKKPKANRLANT